MRREKASLLMFAVWFVFGLVTLHSSTHTCNAFSATISNYKNSLPTKPQSDTNSKYKKQRTTPRENNDARAYCPSCNRPPIQCLCDYLPDQKIALNTKVVVLQHPVEFRRKTVSTVPLLKLVLEHCQVLVGRSFESSIQLQTIIHDACSIEKRIPLLLFPGSDAITLEDSDAMAQLEEAHYEKNKYLYEHGEISDSETGETQVIENEIGHEYEILTKENGETTKNEKSPKYLLIIIDGTWTQAKRMLRYSPVLLEKCHPIQFKGTSDRSIYDSIRKQPDDFCLSTLESCVRTLKLLEPHNPSMKEATEHLNESLKALVRTQMYHEKKSLDAYPDSIRNVAKLKAKMERQKQYQPQISINSEMGVQLNMNTELDGETPQTKTLRRNEREDQSVEKTVEIMDDDCLLEEYRLRPLKLSDAKYVDSRWPYRSNKSLKMIERQINADNANVTRTGKSNVCLGIEYRSNDGDHLVGCILRHRNGSLGILHVDAEHRRRGLGGMLLQHATKAVQDRGETIYAYIVDGNTSSEALFTKLGWMRADPFAKKGTGYVQ